jgi:hypothetical protein
VKVAVLFARPDSVYFGLGVDVWDEKRDARGFVGGCPVVAHPPCRAWGSLAHGAKPPAGEKDLARLAVSFVRRFGGVLEHPARSRLWSEQRMSRTSEPDEWGGWTLPIVQFDFGHRAEKKTLLYIVGAKPGELPPPPIALGRAPRVMFSGGAQKNKRDGWVGFRSEVTRRERDATPPELAKWLIAVAALCGGGVAQGYS